MNYYITRLKIWYFDWVYAIGVRLMMWANQKCANLKNRIDARENRTRLLISEKSKQWRTTLNKSKALKAKDCVLKSIITSENGESLIIPEGSEKRMSKKSK